jgi:hypothetical protein
MVWERAAAAAQPEVSSGGLIFFAVVFFAIGLVSIFYPRLFWWLRVGRKLKDSSPGPLYLGTIRLGGVLVCAVALLILLKAL